MKTAAIIAAAGSGTRMNRTVPKQYLPLGGKPVIVRTLEKLLRIPLIDEIIPVIDRKDKDLCRQILEKHGLTQISRFAEGGATRQESVYNGLFEVGKDFDLVLIHDAVRPFIDEQTILEAIAQATDHKAAAVAVPVKDTVKETTGEGFIKSTVPRGNLWMVQTPQVFSFRLLMQAHKKAAEERIRATDDAALVEMLGHVIKIVEGTALNFKITTAEDFLLAEAILREFKS